MAIFETLVVDSFYLNRGINFETFHTGTLDGGQGSLWLRSVSAVPEPSTGFVVLALGMGCVLRRRRLTIG